MSMKNDDLISRAAAIDAIVFNSENRFAVDVLNDVPAVNAVPVVRCKDCHYWHQELDEVHHWYCTYGWAHQTTPDHYCADGERRDGE